MTREEAIRAMLDGEKVRYCQWPEDEFLFYDSSGFRNTDGKCTDINMFSVCGSGWEIYQEQKKKVKMWKWAFRYTDDDTFFETNAFYADRKQLESEAQYDNLRDVQKLEYSMIEVEE
jgi:hypothetical protein